MEPFLPNRQYGNETLYRMLTAAAGSGHLCHAYLLHGPAGTGKRTLAKWLAAAVLCTGSNRPCGVCPSCIKLMHGSHPDYYFHEGKRGVNAIHIDFIRWMRQDAFIKPNDGPFKVYLIPYAEDFSIQAANALLKVLEEPPSHAVFILTADQRERVLETIRSRCIQLAVYPTDEETLCSFIREKKPDISETDCRRIAVLSAGSMGRAVSLLSGEEGEVPALVMQIVDAYAKHQEYILLTAFQKAASTKEHFRAVLEQLASALREILRNKTVDKRDTPKNGVLLSLSEIVYGIDCIEKALSDLNSNVNLGLLSMQITAALCVPVTNR